MRCVQGRRAIEQPHQFCPSLKRSKRDKYNYLMWCWESGGRGLSLSLSLSTPRTCDTANYKKRRGLGAGKRGACWTAGEKWTEKKKRGKTWKCQVRLLLWEHQSFYKFQQQQRRRLLPSILPFRDVRSALLRPTLSPTLFASIVDMTQRPSCPFLSTCHR